MRLHFRLLDMVASGLINQGLKNSMVSFILPLSYHYIHTQYHFINRQVGLHILVKNFNSGAFKVFFITVTCPQPFLIILFFQPRIDQCRMENQNKRVRQKSLTTFDLPSAFAFWGLGVSLALVAYILEIIHLKLFK